jgi:hypothetical protein
MANYCCAVRTNYFHVKDEEQFRKLMSRAYGTEDEIELWEEKDSEGNAVFGFGLYGAISGVQNAEEDTDPDAERSGYDEFIDGLQKCVADDDAIIILESGNEKLRYVIGSATVITSRDYEYLDIISLAERMACGMLGNAGWTTRCDY